MAKPIEVNFDVEKWQRFHAILRDARPRYAELAKWMGHDSRTVIGNLSNADTQIVRAWPRLQQGDGRLFFSVLSLIHLGLLFQAERRFVYGPRSIDATLSEAERLQGSAKAHYCGIFETYFETLLKPHVDNLGGH